MTEVILLYSEPTAFCWKSCYRFYEKAELGSSPWLKQNQLWQKKKQSQWETAQSFIRLPFGSKASFQDKVGCQNLDVTKYSGFIQYLETNKQKDLPVTYAYWQK